LYGSFTQDKYARIKCQSLIGVAWMIGRSNPTHLVARTVNLDREACLRLEPATGRR